MSALPIPKHIVYLSQKNNGQGGETVAKASNYYYEQLNKEQQRAYYAMKEGLLKLQDSFAVPMLSKKELSDIYFLIFPLDRYVKMFYNCTNSNSTVIRHGGKMKQIVTKNLWERFAFFKELSPLFWRKCGIPALVLNLIIEMLSRQSIWEAFLYAIKTPTLFCYNAFLIATSLALCLLFKRQQFAHAFTCVLWLGTGLIDFVLLQFRTTPFTFVDILLIDSGISIIGHYLPIWQIVLIISILLLVCGICIYWFLRMPKTTYDISLLKRSIFCACLVLIAVGFTRFGVSIQLLERNFGNIAQSFHVNGLPYCFVSSIFGMGIDEPDDYSDEIVQEILDSLQDKTVFAPQPTEGSVRPDGNTEGESSTNQQQGSNNANGESFAQESDSAKADGEEISLGNPPDSTQTSQTPSHNSDKIDLESDSTNPSQGTDDTVEDTQLSETLEQREEAEEHSHPNILFLQLESFFDPTLIKDATFTKDPVPAFRYLKENYTSGYLRVPSFGAGTANTEFEILTGMNLDFFGPGEYPYKTILREMSCENLAFNLSAVGLVPHAIHNNDATFYGRNHIFSQLGFSTFTAIEYMSDYESTPLGWAKDIHLVDVILDALQSTKEQDFVYTISVQGHGSYPEQPLLTNPAIDLTVPQELEEQYYPLLYYVNQIYEMDLFLQRLLYVLDSYPEDVVLVLYGDHLPTFPITDEMLENGSIYETEYIVWSNFPMEREQVYLQAYQLSAYVLGRLDIDEGLLTKYHQTYFSEQKKNEIIKEKDTTSLTEQAERSEEKEQSTFEQAEEVEKSTTGSKKQNFPETIEPGEEKEQQEQVLEKDVHLTIPENEMYLKNLQILEYDMLYGNMDCYNGVNPYAPSDLQLGLHTIRITSVLFREHTDMPEKSLLYIRGENFTECSVVYVNGKQLETFYVNNGTLYVKNAKMEEEETLEIVVKQIGEDGEVLSETEPY